MQVLFNRDAERGDAITKALTEAVKSPPGWDIQIVVRKPTLAELQGKVVTPLKKVM